MELERPEYRVPTMGEIESVKPNGYRLVSTFSGCGGSCLGFRMAGFRTLWASEFIDEAAKTYELNFPDVPVDRRDIRKVSPQQILDAIGLNRKEVDVVEGSPPCASFSTAGKLSRSWGHEVKYSETTQRVDDLFYEFVRIIDGIQPKVFVAENVSGLVRGVAKGYFLDILETLTGCGYRVRAKLLDAQWLGVPQRRKRIIFIGVRSDLKRDPVFPKPLPYRYSIEDALPFLFNDDEWVDGTGQGIDDETIRSSSVEGYALGEELSRLRSGEQSARYFSLVRPAANKPIPTITQTGGSNPGAASVVHPVRARKLTIPELRRLSGFPDDFGLTGRYSQQYERLGRAVPPVMMRYVAEAVREVLDAASP